MKKRFLILTMPLLLLLTLTANAKDIPVVKEKSLNLEPWTNEWFTAVNETYWSKCMEQYGPYHLPNFCTSMGCDDLSCVNPEHFHWCPDICLDETHSHSVDEYEDHSYNLDHMRFRSPCPCHADVPRQPQPVNCMWTSNAF